MKKLAILGAGGHGKVAADIADKLGWVIHVFDGGFPVVSQCSHWSVIGDEKLLIENISRYDAVFFAIGNNLIRESKHSFYRNKGATIATLISPEATVSETVNIGEGVIVMPNCCINIDTKIHDGVIVNTGATIDHDNILQAFSHISPGVHLAGEVTIGERSWVGIGSSVIHQIHIADNVIVGAGAVIINDVPANVTVVGCPAKIFTKN